MSPPPNGPATGPWSDIAYSFGACPHGGILIGRGWDRNQFANGDDEVGADDGDDTEWYSILALIGEGERPTTAMVGAITGTIQAGRITSKCGYRITPHSNWKRKPCPGWDLTVYATTYDNRTLPILLPPLPITEEPDMRIIDNPHNPALLIIGSRYKRLTTDERNAWRDAGVATYDVTDQSYNIIVQNLDLFRRTET
jgi:hypothetical protein